MNQESGDLRFAIFFATWIILGISSFLFFHFYRDSKKKKKALPFVLGGTGVLFVFFVVWVSHGGFTPLLPIVIPVVGLIMYLNYRGTDFCESCGRTLFNQNPFSIAKFCKHCGSELNNENQVEQVASRNPDKPVS